MRPELAAALDVHRHRRLVEDEQVGVADDCHRETDALRLAARELLRALAGDVPSPVSSSASSTSIGSGYSAAIIATSSRTERSRISCTGLEHRADHAGVDSLARGAAEDRDAAAVGLGEAEHHVDRRRLAGAIGPEQSCGLAGSDGHVDAAHRVNRSTGRGERLGQALKADAAICLRRSLDHHWAQCPRFPGRVKPTGSGGGVARSPVPGTRRGLTSGVAPAAKLAFTRCRRPLTTSPIPSCWRPPGI